MNSSAQLILTGLFIATAAQAEFRLSELDERGATKRRKAFTEWVKTDEEKKEEYGRYERKGQFPIYHESSEEGERRLYEDNPDGFYYQFWAIYGEKGFCNKDKELRKENYVLLTASKYTFNKGGTLYRGIWVSRDVEERMERVIRRYGMSQAFISEDHVPAAPSRKKKKK